MKLLVNDACIRCGRCIEACPSRIIDMAERPVIKRPGCIRCGHCEAICPTGALRGDTLNHDGERELERWPVLDGDTAELFLRARRSIRCFKQDPVPQEQTRRLLDIGRYAPTGSNRQGVSYLVLGPGEKRDKLRDLAIAFYRESSEPLYREFYQKFEQDPERITRGAPMCLFALTDRREPRLARNAQFSLTYIELLAPSLGLGTCWGGYIDNYAFSDDAALRELLELPEPLVIGGTLLYGLPKYPYHRLTGRDELKVLWR